MSTTDDFGAKLRATDDNWKVIVSETEPKVWVLDKAHDSGPTAVKAHELTHGDLDDERVQRVADEIATDLGVDVTGRVIKRGTQHIFVIRA